VTDDEARGGGPRRALEEAAESRTLGGLLRRARRLGTVQRRVRAALPRDLAEDCHVVGVDSGHLRLLVSSSVRAAALRFHGAAILAALRDLPGGPVRRLDVVVRPAVTDPGDGRSQRPIGLSSRAADHLAAAAEDESDPELSRALARLARRRR
jgi:hypothetical protein